MSMYVFMYVCMYVYVCLYVFMPVCMLCFQSEGEIVSAAKRAELLRESFEHTENSFKSVASQLSEASKAIGSLEMSVVYFVFK